MADEPSDAAGKRFSRDMRLIREAREASIDSIHKETRISRSLLESFEEGGLYEHPTFNEVYLRSFVRAYADAIEISPDAALDGLDAALEGTYESALADRYLESGTGENDGSSGVGDEAEGPASEMDSDDPQLDTPSAGGPEGRGGIVGPPRAMDEETSEAKGKKEDQPSSEKEASESEKGAPVSTSPPESEDPSDASEVSPPSSASEAAPEPDAEAEVEDEEATDDETEEEPPDDGSEEETSEDESEETSDSSEKRPAWMDEHPEEEAEQAPPTPADEEVSPQPVRSGEEGRSPPEEGVGETGIVGKPTAVGGEEGPAEVARPGASAPASRDSQHRSGWGAVLQGDQREMVWAGLGIVMILLVLVGLGLAYFSGETEPAPDEGSTAVAPDTAETTDASTPDDTTAAPARPPPANVTLGETIYLTVQATAPVTGIRIRRDQDLERPYWIEEGEASVFPFQQRIMLQEELADIEVFLAGYPYRGGRLDTTGQVVITRAQAEAFVDTLRGTPPTLDVTPDTIPKGSPEQPDQ